MLCTVMGVSQFRFVDTTVLTLTHGDAPIERRVIADRAHDGIATARNRRRSPGRPPLDPKTVTAAQKLIEGGLSPGRAAKQFRTGRATACRIAAALRHGRSSRSILRSRFGNQSRGGGFQAASRGYRDPVRLFADTDPPRGPRNLFANVCQSLGGTGLELASILRLDTSDGGGNTHGWRCVVRISEAG